MAKDKYKIGTIKYKPVYAKKKLEEYLKTCEDVESQEVVQENEEKGYKMYKNTLTIKLPTIEGYALFLKIGRATLYEWAKLYPAFKIAMEKIKTIQKQKLIEKSLEGKYNPSIAKLILTNNHDMVDKSDVTSGGDKINTFSDDQINRIADRISRRRATNGGTASNQQPN